MEENSEWKGLTDGEGRLAYHFLCRRCNWGRCSVPFLRNRKFDEQKCKRKRQRDKDNNGDKRSREFMETTLGKWLETNKPGQRFISDFSEDNNNF